MQVHVQRGAGVFLAAADDFFRSDPFSANVIAVVAAQTAASEQPDEPGHFWATVEDRSGRVVGVGMQTPPHRLFLSRMPRRAAAALSRALADAGRTVPGVNGAVVSTEAFAEEWLAYTGQASRVVTAMRMYRLAKLARPLGVTGGATRAVAADDLEVLTGWLAAFHDEAQPRAPVEDWRTIAKRRMAARQFHVWHADATPVAMAAITAPAAGVARVGPVYRSPTYRRRGYGAAIAAEASSAALAAGSDHVVLYADLANPT